MMQAGLGPKKNAADKISFLIAPEKIQLGKQAPKTLSPSICGHKRP
jgi:hypothetical protein